MEAPTIRDVRLPEGALIAETDLILEMVYKAAKIATGDVALAAKIAKQFAVLTREVR